MPHRSSFEALRTLYRSGRLSPVEVAASALDHAERADRVLNMMALIDRERALRAAAQSEARWRAGMPRGPLDGMPVTVKEFASVEGWPTRRGSAVTRADPAAANTPFVERLLDGGATLLGKTRAPEFNWKGVTDSPAFGITRNPWNPALTPGGSSGGCAAAVSAGVVRVSIGSDAGGSVRIPAAFTGLLGLKPSFGRIPASPLPSAFSNVMHIGPIAASAHELAEAMQVCSGPSGQDWTSFTGSVPDDVRAVDRSPRALRIGVLADSRWAQSCPEVHAAMADVVGLLEEDGFVLQTVDYDVVEASAVGAIFYRVGCEATVRAVPPADRHRMDPGLIEFVRSTQDLSLADYLDACRLRDLHANRLTTLFDRIDVLLLPTLPLLPFEAGRLVPAGWASDDWMSWNPFTPAFNVAQVPALSCPVWPEGSALPVGVQFVAPRFQDGRLTSLAAWLETHRPVRTAPSPGAD